LWGLRGWRHGGERRKREKSWLGTENGCFFQHFDPIFFFFMPWNPPLFIEDGRGQSCLHRRKLSALNSVRNDRNRWFKVGTMNCQIWQLKAALGGHFKPAPGTLCYHSALTSHTIKGYWVIILVHELSNLIDIWGIKCTWKVATRTTF